MKNVGAKDIYEVRTMGLVSDLAKRSLIELYMPLVGAAATSTYLCLLSESSTQGAPVSHEGLFARLGLTAGQFVQAMNALEAVGLVRSFAKDLANDVYVLYYVYAPSEPFEFFDDPLLVGTLREKLGDSVALSIADRFASHKTIEEGFEEVSKAFTDYFHPNFDSNAYANTMPNNVSPKGKAMPVTGFDIREFREGIESYNINPSGISEKEVTRIERLLALYNLSTEYGVAYAVESYRPSERVGSRIDFVAFENKLKAAIKLPYVRQKETVKSNVSSDTDIAKFIEYADSVSPVEFLTKRQNGVKPVASDLRILSSLATELGLPNPVINILVSYVLDVMNNTLPRAYTEKVGAALAREGVKTAVDAMNYFNAQKKGSRKGKPARKQTVQEPAETKKKENVISDEELDSLLNNL